MLIAHGTKTCKLFVVYHKGPMFCYFIFGTLTTCDHLNSSYSITGATGSHKCVSVYPVMQRGTEASRSPHSLWSDRTGCRRSSAGTSGKTQQRQQGWSQETGHTCPPTCQCHPGAYLPLTGHTEDSLHLNEKRSKNIIMLF